MNITNTVATNNKKLKVLTPNGYEAFLGINKITKDSYIHLIFHNGSELKCSLDHPLMTIDGIIKAKDLKKSVEVKTKTGGTFLKNYRVIKKKIDLFDIVNSGKDHLYYTNNIVSHNCSFLGSSNTLIAGSKLSSLSYDKPIKSKNKLDVYTEPEKDHVYVITVDVARGVNKDYSAFSVIDITQMPYKQVAKYRDNEIKPLMFPYVIKDVAEHYNKAYILCEVNDVGDQVATGLHDELEYDNMLMCSVSSRKGQVVGQNFSEKAAWGVKMQKNVKKIGCLNLKALIEEDKLIINDLDTINELSTFIAKGASWEADDGKNDDLVITLVIFAWLCTNQYFKDLQDQDLRKKLFEEKMAREEDDILPFGFVELSIPGAVETDNDGNIWMAANPEKEVEDLAQLWDYFY